MTEKHDPPAAPREAAPDDEITQSRKAWLADRQRRREASQAAAKESHESATAEMKKPKKERM